MCTFCSAAQPEPAWRYPCRDAAACEAHYPPPVAGARVELAEPVSAPRLCDFCFDPQLAAWRYPRLDFIACAPCHALIEVGKRKGLAERIYAEAPFPPDVKAAPGSREALIAAILALNDKFFERAVGRPQRVLRLQSISIRSSHTSSPR